MPNFMVLYSSVKACSSLLLGFASSLFEVSLSHLLNFGFLSLEMFHGFFVSRHNKTKLDYLNFIWPSDGVLGFWGFGVLGIFGYFKVY